MWNYLGKKKKSCPTWNYLGNCLHPLLLVRKVLFLKEEQFSWDIGMEYFPRRKAERSCGSPGSVQGHAWSTLGEWEMPLPMELSWNEKIFQLHSIPNRSVIPPDGAKQGTAPANPSLVPSMKKEIRHCNLLLKNSLRSGVQQSTHPHVAAQSPAPADPAWRWPGFQPGQASSAHSRSCFCCGHCSGTGKGLSRTCTVLKQEKKKGRGCWVFVFSPQHWVRS